MSSTHSIRKLYLIIDDEQHTRRDWEVEDPYPSYHCNKVEYLLVIPWWNMLSLLGGISLSMNRVEYPSSMLHHLVEYGITTEGGISLSMNRVENPSACSTTSYGSYT